MDPVIYLVSVPVPFLFGSVVVLNMLENSLFARLAQPAKGVLNVLAAIGFGGGLSLVFWLLMPAVSGALPSGPPARTPRSCGSPTRCSRSRFPSWSSTRLSSISGRCGRPTSLFRKRTRSRHDHHRTPWNRLRKYSSFQSGPPRVH